MKTTNLIVDQGSAVKDAMGSAGKVRSLAADRKISPMANLKAKTSSFGDALEEARGSKGQMNQPKTASPKASAQSSEGSRSSLAKAEPEAAKAVEASTKADETVRVPGSERGQAAAESEKTVKTGEAPDVLKQTVEEPEPAETTTLDAMLMAMAANALVPTPAAEASVDVEGEAKRDFLAPSAETAEGEVSRASLPFSVAEAGGEAPTTSLPLQVASQPMALEALLPQDAAKTMQAVQNRQLMEMLSAPVRTGMAETLLGNAGTAEASLPPEVFSAEALLPQHVPLADEAAEEPLAASAARVQGQEALTEQPLSAVNAAFASKTESLDPRTPAVKQAAESFWQGMSLAVEDTIALPDDAAMRADVGDMAGENAQHDASAPASLTDAAGAVTRQGAQLPEEAAFDVVNVTEGTKSDHTAQPVVSTFTPAVGLTNAAGTAGAAEVPQADGYEVVRQIVEQAKLVRTDGNASEMVIRLKPEHLGELTMRISVAGSGAVNASFHTDNPQTRGLIESSMMQLKQELSAQGIKVDNVSVYSGLSEDFFANSQAGQQGYPQPQHSARSEKADRNAFAGDAEAVSAVGTEQSGSASSLDPNVGTADGVDYRV
ncbi:MAG: flagellar hook-length control protein FliK [Schwartzia sp. (in: firmicutes)]